MRAETRNPGGSDLDAVTSEFVAESEVRPSRSGGRREYRRVAILSAVGVILLAALGVGRLLGAGAADAALRIESEPGGAEVQIDGQPHGMTPVTVALAPGAHDLVVRRGDLSKDTRLTLQPAERATYHVAWLAAAVASTPVMPPVRGSLSVITEPAAGSVILDGVARGVAPLLIDDLAVGDHELEIRNQGSISRRRVTVSVGSTAEVTVRNAAPVAAAGWLSVNAPFTLEIHEDGRLIGTTAPEKIMLPVGQHQLEFSDDAVGFRISRTVRIAAGETTPLALQVPRVPVNVNAIPWAEVWIDGQRVGETPIGNHLLSIGPHTVELRHPEFGNKRVVVAVSLKNPVRVAVNMRER
jgi:hypothetical protein